MTHVWVVEYRYPSGWEAIPMVMGSARSDARREMRRLRMQRPVARGRKYRVRKYVREGSDG